MLLLRRPLLRWPWLLLLVWVVPSSLLVLLELLLVGIPPASLGAVPLPPADIAPKFSFWKLLLPLALVGCRLGRESFPFSFGWLAFSFSFSIASFVKLLLVVRVWLLAFPFACLFAYLSKLYPIHCSSWTHSAHRCC